MTAPFIEDTVEQAALSWLRALGYETIYGPEIAPGEPAAERDDYQQVTLSGRLRTALRRLNPNLPPQAIDDAYTKLLRVDSPSLLQNNHRFHQLLINGVDVQYQQNGRTVYHQAKVINFDKPAANEWLAINQFAIQREGAVANPNNPLEGTRRPDILIFVNGLPLAVIELKNAADEGATVETAYNQLLTYQDQITQLFVTKAALVVADGTDTRLGVLGAGWNWFKPWRAIDPDPKSPTIMLEDGRTQLETLLRGVFSPDRFLDLVRYFTVFEDHGARLIKKMAGYHQYHAANKAVTATLDAIQDDRRVGVIWHTQGSGKSLSMLFYSGKIIQTAALRNPTLVLLTDRNDLDDQLLDTFNYGHELLRQVPEQAESIDDLRDRLNVASGHVVFTTIQKFSPPQGQTINQPVSECENIIFIVDEAHRSQYGFQTRFVQYEDGIRRVYGLAQHMRDALPNASFIGFTGTPIALTDRNTINVFGDYIDIYVIQRAVEDGATVPIYYEARHAKLKLDPAHVPTIDEEFEEVTEGQEIELEELEKSKWARLAAIVGEPDRLDLVAQDFVDHYEARAKALPGKAMIVGMTRDICVRLYDAIVKLRPTWDHKRDDDQGKIKVVMSGSASDKPAMQPPIRSKRRRKNLANRFRDPDSGFDVVIVRDMWLTGFDAPSLHTRYVDKPMRGHGLMQAIARVNRVYPEKTGGLVVAYLPLELRLQEALKDYTEGDRKNAGLVQDTAAAEMKRYYHIVKDMFHGFDYMPFIESEDPGERLTILAGAAAHILSGRDKKRNRYIDQTTALGRAYSLANPHEDAISIRDEVAFFQAVKATLVKTIKTPVTKPGKKTPQEVDEAIQEIIDRVVAPDGIVDLLSVAGLERPEIGILSDEFLAEVEALPHKDLAVELLRRLIEGLIKSRQRRSMVQARSFSIMLQDALKRYNTDAISAAKIITELVKLAKQINAEKARGEELGLTPDELSFYDALEVNDSAVAILGDEALKEIAQELVKKVRGNISIDWELKESSQARMRIIVKRILRRYGYPPDKQRQATETVVKQAEWLSREWVAI